jgi:hypothetical protein
VTAEPSAKPVRTHSPWHRLDGPKTDIRQGRQESHWVLGVVPDLKGQAREPVRGSSMGRRHPQPSRRGPRKARPQPMAV